MAVLTTLNDPNATLVADSSTVINVIATGEAEAILAAIPNRIVVVDVVLAELETGKARGHTHADRLNDLVAGDLVKIVVLGEVAMREFETLVVGHAAATLDDGEAGTIAYAVNNQSIALIDERKAVRICGERYPALGIACTVDLLMHRSVVNRIGSKRLSDAVYAALRDGRMRVFPQHVDLVVALIGPARAADCRSLPRAARLLPDSLVE